MKPDADEIRIFLKGLEAEPWLTTAQRSWPRFIWHYSDIRNVASILIDGAVQSRRSLIASGRSAVEIAQLAIIEQSPWAHRYARFYFRPATPTQHGIEGIRARIQVGRAHCPVPVFLLFDASEVLTRDDALFTNQNFARIESEVGETGRFLRTLNFRNIYHDSSLPPGLADRQRIIGARCAEVLVPGEMDLRPLRQVVCRTGAERRTLLSLLGTHAPKWRPLIRLVQPGERIFFREHTYVQDVRLVGPEVIIDLGGQPRSIQPYSVRVKLDGGVERRYEGFLNGPRLRIPIGSTETRAAVQIEISDSLAFRDWVRSASLLEST